MLVVVLALVAINAFLGGYYALAGAKHVPTEWLSGSPFEDYSIPGAILIVVVGGSCLAAAIAEARRATRATFFAAAAAAILAGWIAIQVAIIGLVSWLQPAMAITAIAIGVLALLSRTTDSPRRTLPRSPHDCTA